MNYVVSSDIWSVMKGLFHMELISGIVISIISLFCSSASKKDEAGKICSVCKEQKPEKYDQEYGG